MRLKHIGLNRTYVVLLFYELYNVNLLTLLRERTRYFVKG